MIAETRTAYPLPVFTHSRVLRVIAETCTAYLLPELLHNDIDEVELCLPGFIHGAQVTGRHGDAHEQIAIWSTNHHHHTDIEKERNKSTHISNSLAPRHYQGAATNYVSSRKAAKGVGVGKPALNNN